MPNPSNTPEPKGERIAKYLSRAGQCSRREAEKWILAGKVSVNGKTVLSPVTFVSDEDTIQIEGRLVEAPTKSRLWMYHKPRGLVTTHRDPEGRATVFASLPPEMPRVVSIGRLDLNSEGLLLLTNSGAIAHYLESPRNGWVRQYRVRVFGNLILSELEPLKRGITIDGIHYAPIHFELERQLGKNSWLTIHLQEGKNREIRKVLEHFGLQVNRLIRTAYGPFQLGFLPEGTLKEISHKVIANHIPKEVFQ